MPTFQHSAKYIICGKDCKDIDGLLRKNNHSEFLGQENGRQLIKRAQCTPVDTHSLIAVDGSEHSERAFKFYLNNTCKKGDHVVVFHAQEMPTLPAAPYPYGFAYYEEWQDVMKKADEEAKVLLRHYGDVLKTNPDIKFKLVKEGGRPGELICKNSVEENAALVVLGCRGQSAVRRTFLGSVSDYVVHHSHIPICIVPPQDRHA